MIEAIVPAPHADLFALAAPGGRAPAGRYRVFLMQHAWSDTIAFRIDGRPVAVAGFAPIIERDAVELWLVTDPGAGAHLLPVLRRLRLTLAAFADHGVTVRAVVTTGHASGERLARLVGMRLVSARDGVGIWESAHGRDRTATGTAAQRCGRP